MATKTDEIILPQSCLNMAVGSELMLILLARDAAASDTVRFWAGMRVKLGLNGPDDPQIAQAMALADLMQEQLPVIRAELGKELRHVRELRPDEVPTVPTTSNTERFADMKDDIPPSRKGKR